MRANYKMQRLFLDAPLTAGSAIGLDKAQSNYLLNVLRMDVDAEILVFNGRDGEFRARVEKPAKKIAALRMVTLERPQPSASKLHFCFAPLKIGRLDYMVQKAVEMGAGVLQPVITEYTQNHRLSADKMRSWAIEAAEQCGVLAVPECCEPVKFDDFLRNWPNGKMLIFCDEAADTRNPVAILQALDQPPLGVLIGPEGGFSDGERHQLRAVKNVVSIPLGPRILRADTAAVAAMTVIQAAKGDW